MEKIDYVTTGQTVRGQIVEIVANAGRGHLASAFSLVEILNVLYERVLKFDASNPNLEDRDRLILSKGHGCLALYPILANHGFFPNEELSKFCSLEGILGGHPEHLKIPGVEASTGALGHGLSLGIGMAMAAKMDKKNYRSFVILGDGECDEGTVWEAALHANKHKLDNLVALIDYNKFQSYGSVKEVLDLEPFTDKWESFGFSVNEVDMKDPQKLEEILLALPFDGGKPHVVICHTIKGAGVSFMEHNLKWHHKSRLTEEEVNLLKNELNLK